MSHRFAAVAILALALAASLSPGAVSAGEEPRPALQFPKGDVVAHIVFDGSGTATGPSGTDDFKWHMVYDIDTSAISGPERQTIPTTWQFSQSASWDSGQSSFTGTTSGPQGCHATFALNRSVPSYTPRIKGPVKNDTVQIALIALVQMMVTSGPGYCNAFALNNTCDNYNTKYGFTYPNEYVIADFGLNLVNPEDTGTVPVSSDHSWTCSNGPGSGTVQWNGTITVGGNCASTGASSQDTSTQALGRSHSRLANASRFPTPTRHADIVMAPALTPGCVRIIWTNPPNGAAPLDVTAAELAGKPVPPVEAGYKVDLKVELECKCSVSSAVWVIDGPAVGSYNLATDLAPGAAVSSTPLVPADLHNQTIHFFWFTAGDEGKDAPGSARMSDYQVQVSVNGNKQTASAEFKVTTPAWSLDPQFGCVGIDTDQSLGTKQGHTSNSPVPKLSFGFNNEPKLPAACQSKPGMRLEYEAPGAKPGSELGVVQLLNLAAWHDDHECKNLQLGGASSRWMADNSDFYAYANPPNLAADDTPALTLSGKSGTILYSFEASDYLMYRPLGQGSIWVPVGWFWWHWSGQVTKQLFGGWKLDSAHDGQAVENYYSLPEWSGAYHNGSIFAAPC